MISRSLLILYSCLSLAAVHPVHGYNYEVLFKFLRVNADDSKCRADWMDELAAKLESGADYETCHAYSGKKLKPVKVTRRNLRHDQGQRELSGCDTYWEEECGASSGNCHACCLWRCPGAYGDCIADANCEERRRLEDVTFEDFEQEMRRLGDVKNHGRLAAACKRALKDYASDYNACMGDISQLKCAVDIIEVTDATEGCH